MSVTINWSQNTDPEVASYVVERASTSTGSWVQVVEITNDIQDPDVFDAVNNLFFYSDPVGTEQTWYRVKTLDIIGQSSPYTAPFQAAGTEPGLVTLAELKALLSISTGSTSDDGLLQSLINAASNWIETQCGRQFSAQLYTETYSGNGGTILHLRQPQVLDIISVVLDGTEVNARTSVTASDGYTWSGGVLYYGQKFTTGVNNVTVSYVAGFRQVPNDVKQAVLWLAASWYRERTRLGVMSSAVGGEAVSYQTLTFPAHVQQTIDGFKRMPVFGG